MCLSDRQTFEWFPMHPFNNNEYIKFCIVISHTSHSQMQNNTFLTQSRKFFEIFCTVMNDARTNNKQNIHIYNINNNNNNNNSGTNLCGKTVYMQIKWFFFQHSFVECVAKSSDKNTVSLKIYLSPDMYHTGYFGFLFIFCIQLDERPRVDTI